MPGRRHSTWATTAGLYCGASLLKTLSRFHTMASASTSEPSWKRTPGRSRIVHLVFSASSTDQPVASPGFSGAATSDRDRSQSINASYSV